MLNFRAAAEELNYSHSTVFIAAPDHAFSDLKKIKNGELVVLPVELDNILIHAKMIYHINKWMSSPLETLKDIILLKKAGN